jgi:hypothetical protein
VNAARPVVRPAAPAAGTVPTSATKSIRRLIWLLQRIEAGINAGRKRSSTMTLLAITQAHLLEEFQTPMTFLMLICAVSDTLVHNTTEWACPLASPHRCCPEARRCMGCLQCRP